MAAMSEPSPEALEVEDMLHACGWENLLPGQREKCEQIAAWARDRAATTRLDLLTALSALAVLAEQPTDAERQRGRDLVAELGARYGLPGVEG